MNTNPQPTYLELAEAYDNAITKLKSVGIERETIHDITRFVVSLENKKTELINKLSEYL